MSVLLRVGVGLAALLVSPLLIAVTLLALGAADLFWLLFGRKRPVADTRPSTASASVVIPNWNGRDLLEKYLPPLIEALAGHPDNEIIVVDNGSSDGSAEFVRGRFPGVRLLVLEKNLGFGGGSNAGFRAAKNDVVVLLNSDMRVAPDFLQPLLDGFHDEKVFAVSCQIFFTDPSKLREETGLTQGWWQDGNLRVRHRIDSDVTDLYPCFYGGGGSCAFDRRKFLEIGQLDSLLAPFYLEDTDLGYLAWKRGWKVYYQPRSVVYHEHRGTIGRKFTQRQIQAVLKKNFLLFCWKNIHEWRRLAAHFGFTWFGSLIAIVLGDAVGRPNFGGFWRAFRQLPAALRSRWRARSLAVVSDEEAFRRPLGGYFRDRFGDFSREPERLRVLFVSPYPILPPVHGGGVFMYQTLGELVKRCEVHAIALLDYDWQAADHAPLRRMCASAEFLVRWQAAQISAGSMLPHAVTEFSSGDLEWLIHRLIYVRQIDVLQLEYSPMSQYAGHYRRIVSAVFEHDIYFQAVARGLDHAVGLAARMKARFEYLRALRYELSVLPRCDRVQVCTRDNKEYLASFLPEAAGRIQDGLRAGIDTARYCFRNSGREPDTLLFIGSFRHVPNQVALEWFTRDVLPEIRRRRPKARLVVAGSDPPPPHAYTDEGVEMLGFVEDIRELLARCAVFVCPILSGSGVRVKLLEAFASGIPVVSTRIGAEGLGVEDGRYCRLADEASEFAEKTLALLSEPDEGAAMAARARREVEENWDMVRITARLEASYREAVRQKAGGLS